MENREESFLILFDMDGVLLDSAAAITGSLLFALQKNGQSGFDGVDLTQFVGPPLAVMIEALLPDSSQETKDQCAVDYRIHNNLNGPNLTAVYEGIQDVLIELSQKYELRVATSKLESAAQLVLKSKNLDHFFRGIHGSSSDGTDSKTDVMDRAIVASRASNPRVIPLVMIGDRRHDIEGAKNLGIESIGVTWGYAPSGELSEAGANHLVSSPQQMLSVVNQLTEKLR
jgi:phosphoglycolate phosphatase